jgi:AraC-like DNA-binding protein/tetratricopeptide (TPR) repeat protein
VTSVRHSQSMQAPLPRSVRRALDAMHAATDRDWRARDLGAVAGVSGRTLQRQFRAFLGRSPQDALRDIRFDAARRALLHAGPDTRILDVALRFGFQHLGRFSVEYRRRYGEMPSQTLKRQSVFHGVVAAMNAFLGTERDRPTIALDDINTAPAHADLARDLLCDLGTALTRSGAAVVGADRAARYRLVGAMRGDSSLTFRLIDSATGHHLSAWRHDGALPGGSSEPLVTRITAALQPGLRIAEIERALRKPEDDLGARDLALRAMPGVLSLDQAGNAEALELLERAIERDPDHPLAMALAAWARVQRVVYHFSPDPAAERARSISLARKAQALHGDATALAVLGNALTLLDDLDGADQTIRTALALDGGSAWAWSRSGWIDVYKGHPEAAIERFKIALDLAPHDSLAFNSLVGIGCAHFKAGQYDEAARWQAEGLRAHPSSTWVHRTLCPAYLLAGAKPEARRSLIALRDQYPDLTIAEVQQGMPPLPQSYRDKVIDALHSVGLPG